MAIVPQQPLVHSSTLERYPKPQTEHKGTNAKLGIPLYAPYKTLNKTTTHPQTQTTDEAQRACQPEALDLRHESKGYSSNFVSRVWGFGAFVYKTYEFRVGLRRTPNKGLGDSDFETASSSESLSLSWSLTIIDWAKAATCVDAAVTGIPHAYTHSRP